MAVVVMMAGALHAAVHRSLPTAEQGLVAAVQRALQQPWLLLALLGLLGHTRFVLHLALQTAGLLPVLLAALYSHVHAAARQQGNPLLRLLCLEVARQLLVSFLLVSLLVLVREARCRHAFARGPMAGAGSRSMSKSLVAGRP
jgi:hypothetical protein